jgi:type III secretion protein N (ATPase)
VAGKKVGEGAALMADLAERSVGVQAQAQTPKVRAPKAADIAARITQHIGRAHPVESLGRVAEAYGTIIKVTGLSVRIGELCELKDLQSGVVLQAEVVGLQNGAALLTPLGSLNGISTGTEVSARGQPHRIGVSPQLLGRIVDAHGLPIDGGPALSFSDSVPVYRDPPDPVQRPLISEPFCTGVKAIDGLLTCGEGQRVGVFAMAGAGKSTLLGMLARSSQSDVNVIALVGERGREVNEFIVDNLGPEGLRRSVVVVATSDRPALERAKAAYVATAIAEYFRDQGKRVLLLVDSITRFARALRDVGLSVGELPVRRGFPPSVFTALPSLFERAGRAPKGSITAYYAVLLEDEDMVDPVAEETRSILDGHIYLSRKLASAHHFPAIDVLASASRLMLRIAPETQARAAGLAKKHLAKYLDIELLLQIGEYKPGGDAEADEAVKRNAPLKRLLQQSVNDRFSLDDSVRLLHEALK